MPVFPLHNMATQFMHQIHEMFILRSLSSTSFSDKINLSPRNIPVGVSVNPDLFEAVMPDETIPGNEKNQKHHIVQYRDDCIGHLLFDCQHHHFQAICRCQ